MKKLALSLFVNGLSLYLIGRLLSGITLNTQSLVILTVVFVLLNTIIKPILKLLALPLTILTLGLFSFVINGLVLYWAFLLVPGVSCDGLGTGIIASIVLSICNFALNKIFKK